MCLCLCGQCADGFIRVVANLLEFGREVLCDGRHDSHLSLSLVVSDLVYFACLEVYLS